MSLAGFENETWINLDMGRRQFDVTPLFAQGDVRDYLSYLSAKTVVLRFGPAAGPGTSFLRPMTCVAFVKHALGVRSRALLPDALFTTLTAKYGAEIMNEDAKGPGRNG